MADFDLKPTTYTVADYCQMYDRGEIRVNREYQRSDKVWPLAAQSFLIETILLGYPMPKLSLHQVTDLKTRKTVKEIVDGQQRTRAVKSFYDCKLRLSRTLKLQEAAGCTYEDLPEELRQAFLDYAVPVDIFTGASPEQIREVFRRINSYTVPLNPEEQRHAHWQGEMKWFIYSLSNEYDTILLQIGTFTESRLVRMADAKLFAEIIHAFTEGVSTTNKRKLDALYKNYDKEFDYRTECERRFRSALEVLLELEELHGGPLMRPHMMYSLLLAIMHVLDPVEVLNPIRHVEAPVDIDKSCALPRLTALAEAARGENEDAGEFTEFVEASEARTNVKEQREIRVRWFVDALLCQ